MSESRLEEYLRRLEAGDSLSTAEMMEFGAEPDAIVTLIAAMREDYPLRRRNAVGLLTDLGRIQIPAEGPVPQRPGPIVTDERVIGYLVELLDDPDREARNRACISLAALVPGEKIEPHAEEILQRVERYPDTDGAILLLGKTGSETALEWLKTRPEIYGSAPDDAEMARARLGDEEAESAVLAAYREAEDTEERALEARRLGYVGSQRTVRLLAQNMRTAESYVWNPPARRSLRVHLIEGLHLAYLTEPLFWKPLLTPWDDSYYVAIEEWLTAQLGVTWDDPRPEFMYQESAATPAPPTAG